MREMRWRAAAFCGISSSIATFQVTCPIATTAVFLRHVQLDDPAGQVVAKARDDYLVARLEVGPEKEWEQCLGLSSPQGRPGVTTCVPGNEAFGIRIASRCGPSELDVEELQEAAMAEETVTQTGWRRSRPPPSIRRSPGDRP